MIYGNSLLQDRVLFATDDMIPWQRCVDELKALPLQRGGQKKMARQQRRETPGAALRGLAISIYSRNILQSY
jgi:hypothetical protein